MEENRTSITAQMTAYFRWHHFQHDAPLVFADPLAGAILSEAEREAIETVLLDALKRVNPEGAAAFPDAEAALAWMMQTGASTPIVLSRARYAEEMLQEAIEAGVDQYVVLGAGLDTFAFRRSDLMRSVAVFEIDHPATQQHKRQRIRELGWDFPDNLHFVPVDFSCDRLATELRRSSFRPDRPTFFSWLGVSYYLSPQEVEATLRQVASSAPPGSRIVFDYLDLAAYQLDKAAFRVVRMVESVQSLGEPMVSGLDGRSLAEELARYGLELRENLGPNDIHRRYFLGRTDFHRACEHVHFAHATVK